MSRNNRVNRSPTGSERTRHVSLFYRFTHTIPSRHLITLSNPFRLNQIFNCYCFHMLIIIQAYQQPIPGSNIKKLQKILKHLQIHDFKFIISGENCLYKKQRQKRSTLQIIFQTRSLNLLLFNIQKEKSFFFFSNNLFSEIFQVAIYKTSIKIIPISLKYKRKLECSLIDVLVQARLPIMSFFVNAGHLQCVLIMSIILQNCTILIICILQVG